VTVATVAWAGLLKQLLVTIATYDKKIDELARAHPDYALVKSLPGAGPAMAPRLIAALGSQRERYQSAAELQRYSGKQHWVHWRWACPKFLRQTFHEWALHSIAYSDWAREYYEQQRAKGKRRNTAIRSLAFKWIRILFVAGRIASRTTRQSTNEPWQRAGRVSRSRLQLWNSSGKKSQASAKLHPQGLDRRPQMSILLSGMTSIAFPCASITLSGKVTR